MNEIKELIYSLVGNTSVAQQLDTALRMHEHANYPTREEYEKLRKDVDKLLNLVGNTSVSEQINNALNG